MYSKNCHAYEKLHNCITISRDVVHVRAVKKSVFFFNIHCINNKNPYSNEKRCILILGVCQAALSVEHEM